MVTPSEETTFLTDRRLEDGSLDFSTALWHHCNLPIDNSENAAIALRELADPLPLGRFLSRYAVQQADSPEQAREIFDVLLQEQGHNDSFAHTKRRLSQRYPWTRERFPAIANLLEVDTDYMDRWKSAVDWPAISKPVGTRLDEIQELIFQGAVVVSSRTCCTPVRTTGTAPSTVLSRLTDQPIIYVACSAAGCLNTA